MVKKELEQKVETLIGEYIKVELAKLDSGEATSVDLKNVSLRMLERYLEDDHEDLEFNGWQGDYWCTNSRYKISGCMYDATVTVSLGNEEE